MDFKIDKGAAILLGVTFDCAANFSLGRNSVINSKARMDNRGGLVIGDNVSISQEVILLTADHDPATPGLDGRNKPIVINDFVWIGTRAMVLPGVLLGNASIVAAGALVVKDTGPFEIVAGVPAKKIKDRNSEVPTYTVSYRRKFH